MKKSYLLVTLRTCLLFMLGSISFAVNATTVTIGPTDSGGECTFPCMVRLQQAYDSSSFSETINIGTVNYFSTGDSHLNATYDFYFGYMNGDYSTITTDFNGNIGSNYQLFESKVFAQTFSNGEIISFNGSFIYDPSLGDLLIDIVRHSETDFYDFSSNSGFIASGFGLPLSRAYQWPNDGHHSGGTGSAVGFGLTTQFVENSVVPIPAALWLFGSGLLGLIGIARKEAS